MVDIVVIGAGPYGLSIAAHLQQIQLSFRISALESAALLRKQGADIIISTRRPIQ